MSHKKRRISYYLFSSFAILSLGLSLAGYLGRINLYLEFTSGYKLQFLLVGLCCLVYFTLTRIKLWVAISLFSVLLNLAEILPWYMNQPQINNNNNYQPLKVISYNVLWDNKNYEQAISFIHQQQPDIAIFQEAIEPWAKHLSVLKANYPYHIEAKKLEIEVYSKYPLSNTEIKLYGTYRGLVISDLKIDQDRQIKLIATHAYPQLYYGQKGWQIRNEHLEKGIGEYVNNLKQSVIVAGDLNVSMWSPFYHSLIKQSGLHNARQGFGILPTQSGINPQLAIFSAPIDHCLISSDIKVKNFRLGKHLGSDHLPIIVELLIPI